MLFNFHTFIENGFWLLMLTLATIAWFFAAREQYYRWRFLLGKPPKPRTKRSFRFWRRKKQQAAPTSEPVETVIREESILPSQPGDKGTDGTSQHEK